MIEFECSGCSAKLTVKDDAAGKRARCRKCQTVVVVPAPGVPTPPAAQAAPTPSAKRAAASPAPELGVAPAPPVTPPRDSTTKQFSLIELAEQYEVETPPPPPTPPPAAAPVARRPAPDGEPDGNPHADRARKWAIRSLIMLPVVPVAWLGLTLAVALTLGPRNMGDALNQTRAARTEQAMFYVRLAEGALITGWALMGVAAMVSGALGLRAVGVSGEGKGRAVFGLAAGVIPIALIAAGMLAPGAPLLKVLTPQRQSGGAAAPHDQTSDSPARKDAPSLADDAVLIADLMRQAQELGDATVRRDHVRVADFTLPKIVEAAGGRQALIESLAKRAAQGTEVVSVTVGTPTQVKQAGKYVLAMVPTTTNMRVSGRTRTLYGSLLAASPDQGGTWQFVDGRIAQEPYTLKRVLPEAVGVFDEPAPRPALRPDPVSPPPTVPPPAHASATTLPPAVENSAMGTEAADNLLARARQMQEAKANGSPATVAGLIHPRILEGLGGRDALVARLQGEYERSARVGARFVAGPVAKPAQFYEIGAQVFAVVPTTMITNTRTSSRTSASFLLGISADKGSTWTFLDHSDPRQVVLRPKVFPEVFGKIPFPESKPDVVVPATR